MAIEIRDIQNTSPQLRVEGDIEFQPSEVQDETNAMVVGPAERGPIFVPTEVRTREQFETIFGPATTYSSFSAAEVLEQTDRVKFTRIAAATGWDPTPLAIFGEGGTDFPHFESGAQEPLAIFIFSNRYKRVQGAVPNKTRILKSTADQNKTAENFTMRTFDQDDNLVDEFRLSLNPFSGRYAPEVLPPDIRIYQNFRESQLEIVNDEEREVLISLTIFDDEAVLNPLEFESFDAPRTPWILSQEIPPDDRHRLFRIWVRSDGEDENRRFKVSITDVGRGRSESGWPLFTLKLRDFDDTDLNQEVIEEYDDLSLNSQDERFIGKVIGTEFQTYNEQTGRINSFGAFDQQSLNIRVELSSEIGRSSRKTLPYGFSPYKQTFTESSQVPVYRTADSVPGELIGYIERGRAESERGDQSLEEELHFGVNFQVEQNENFFQGIPKGAEDAGDGFRLDDTLPTETSTPDERKFSVGFQGGADGSSIYREEFSGSDIETRNTFGINFASGDEPGEGPRQSPGQIAYRTAFDILSDPSAGFNFDLLTTPELDIQNHEQTIRNAERLVQERGEAFYVFDAYERGTEPEEAINTFFTLDTNRAATYYGWVRPVESEFDFVPPSAIIPQTYAQSDVIADPWFAPAGPDRGQVPRVEDTEIRLQRDQIDQLYGKSVNVIKLSDARGINLAGNRTFFSNLDSSLSSIDVRRTLVFIISRTRRIAEDYLFEQADEQTAQNFRSDIADLLSTIQSRNGIRRYQINISTPRSRGRNDRRPNTLSGTISVIPQPSVEYITVDFTISEEGVEVIG
jgi:hypothetical protein